MGQRHVVPGGGGGGWKVVGAATGSTESSTSTQADAIDEARKQLEDSDGGEILIHGVDGSVRDRRTVQPS
ncbi:DUF2188 domain-containing protein [Actinopolyspora erythraea]|uniref:DUF2188 domain-containing protein n=1 Tax=Actinopolyspora erythraea TaxID=414996 RepID=A0A099D0F6_9ACTN|nr:DUF2188 domain-containing protein [Actinopolyspora erythraea]ASU79652.1 DUF2188 domain-containing protein [Actinopolyspora erythraea]KGI79421.1 hypothetical protein IL38_23305 [Actinopolyspora erythraea]